VTAVEQDAKLQIESFLARHNTEKQQLIATLQDLFNEVCSPPFTFDNLPEVAQSVKTRLDQLVEAQAELSSIRDLFPEAGCGPIRDSVAAWIKTLANKSRPIEPALCSPPEPAKKRDWNCSPLDLCRQSHFHAPETGIDCLEMPPLSAEHRSDRVPERQLQKPQSPAFQAVLAVVLSISRLRRLAHRRTGHHRTWTTRANPISVPIFKNFIVRSSDENDAPSNLFM
jgi:hypothetical protein